MLVKVGDTVFIKYDEKSQTSHVIDSSVLLARKEAVEARIAELDDVSDENLLKWARENYPGKDGIREKSVLDIELGNITEKLREINE